MRTFVFDSETSIMVLLSHFSIQTNCMCFFATQARCTCWYGFIVWLSCLLSSALQLMKDENYATLVTLSFGNDRIFFEIKLLKADGKTPEPQVGHKFLFNRKIGQCILVEWQKMAKKPRKLRMKSGQVCSRCQKYGNDRYKSCLIRKTGRSCYTFSFAGTLP